MNRRRRERRQALIQALERLRETGPLNGGAAAHGRARFLQLAAALRQERDYALPNGLAALLRGARTPRVHPWRVAVTLVTTLALLLAGTGVGVAAQDRLPGDLLYPVKTALEEGHALITTEPVARTWVASAYTDRRIQELDALLDAERYAGVPVVIDGLARWVYEVRASLEQAVAQDGAEADALAEMVLGQTDQWAAALAEAIERVPSSLRPGLAATAALVAEVALTAAEVGHEENEIVAATATPDPGEDATATDDPGAPSPSPAPSDTPAPDDAAVGADDDGRNHIPPGLTRTPPGLDDGVTPPGLEREESTKLPPGQVKPKKTKDK